MVKIQLLHLGLHLRLSVGNVVAHRVVEEDRLLRHLRHLAAQRTKRQIVQVVAVDENGARCDIEEARNQVDQRRFARPARPHQRKNFTRVISKSTLCRIWCCPPR